MSGLFCQKCRTPLKVDASLEDLNPASFKILADAAPSLEPKAPDAPRSAAAKERQQHYNDVSTQAGPPLQKRNVLSASKVGNKANPDMSYIMLTESQFGPEAPDTAVRSPSSKKTAISQPEAPNGSRHDTELLSQQMETALRLFEILSSRSDIDHPVCSECTELLLDGMQKRQAAVTRERDAYVEFLKQAQENLPTDEERATTARELEEARRRERKAIEDLKALEAEKVSLEAEIAALDAEAEELDDEEEAFWRERNAFTAELTAFREERDSLQIQLANDSKLLEALQRTNVYNDSFCIGHDGLFATINGLRLGRLPDSPVDWTEINAAWGQAVLLLSVVAEKFNVTLQGYRLLPMGSTSKIEKLEYPQTASNDQSRTSKPKATPLELYSSGDLPLGLNFLHRSFDNAMVAFLDCVRQLGDYVHHVPMPAQGTLLKMPYTINKDKIGDVSIKLGNFGQDEQWTKACKYTLTCCKFLLAHASHMDHQDDNRSPR